MESLASRRSEFGEEMKAADSHCSPSMEEITRIAPSGDTCCEPSLKAQNHRSRKKIRSVNALCLASSQIRRAETSSNPPSSCPINHACPATTHHAPNKHKDRHCARTLTGTGMSKVLTCGDRFCEFIIIWEGLEERSGIGMIAVLRLNPKELCISAGERFA